MKRKSVNDDNPGVVYSTIFLYTPNQFSYKDMVAAHL